MSAASAVGALVGAGLAGGMLLVVSGVAARRPRPIGERIAPFLEGPSATLPRSDDHGVSTDASTLVRLLGPGVRAGARRVHALLGGGDELARRLAAAGRDPAPEAFRADQVTWALGAIAVAAAAVSLLALAGEPVRAPAAFLVVVLAGAGGWLGVDRALTRAVRQRQQAVRAGLPAVADLLALAVASGESPAAALDRVGRVARGPLAQECRRASHDTTSGVSFVDALARMADRVGVPAVRRFVDGISIAVQRGTPLADVLRAQAGDARADVARSLLELAGRKELLMLVPVVFLVLPTVVLVALFPAFSSLTMVTP
jgi:tight adherence protein C